MGSVGTLDDEGGERFYHHIKIIPFIRIETQNAKEQQRLGYAPASSCGVFGRFPWVIYHNGAFQWS